EGLCRSEPLVPWCKGLQLAFLRRRRERPCRRAASCAPLKPRIAPYHIVEKTVLRITVFWHTKLPQRVKSERLELSKCFPVFSRNRTLLVHISFNAFRLACPSRPTMR